MQSLDLQKFRLYGGRMNALIVEEFFHFLGNVHVFAEVSAPNVSRRNDAIAGQLPHMELMHGQYAVHLFQQALLNGIDLHLQ